MLVFLDTEFTDFIDCELISIGMVSEDGQYELYLEVKDFDRAKCNYFVQAAVLPSLGLINGSQIRRSDLRGRILEWFSSLPEAATVAADSIHDRDLLADVLDGEWPENLDNWYDLRELTVSPLFEKAIAKYHSAGRPWHHALFDAYANRAGWMAVLAVS
ncbi:3'-5' exoribonuclease [Chromobacterium aquaticum]|uniref:3'-5' exoribonuclease n=1 Tax=Chromobacterium aquaticum TaxID=467180 RepID=A0ABV8ZL67_9NEIS|nr:3'-5' exoribonuclease [Chromobacterium aquaticum]MCD5361259.1 3'-5' exoribonuclease [Chromobacterium aquaticum]